MDNTLIPPGLPGEDGQTRSEQDNFIDRALALTKERQAEPETAIPQTMPQDDFVSRAVARTKERQQKAQETESARQAMVNHLYVQSSDQTPESYAEAMRLGKALNRPAGLIALDMDNYRTMAGNQKIAAVAERSRNVTRFLGKRENAIVASGDIDLLEKLEWESSSWAYRGVVKGADFARSIPSGAIRAYGGAMSGMGNILDALDQERVKNLTEKGFDPEKLNPGGVGDLVNAVFGTDFSSTGDMLKQGADPTKRFAEWISPPQYRRGFTDDVGDAIGNVTGQIATAFLTRGYGTTAMTFGQGADQQVDEAKAVGKNPQLAEMILGGLSTMITEKLGRDLITGGVKALPKPLQSRFTAALGGYPVVMAGEGMSEGLDQLAQNTIASVRTNPDKDLTEGVAYSALLGAIAGGVVHGGVRLVESRLNQQQAQTEHNGLSDALDTLASTKMYQLAPDKAGEAFAQITGADTIHIDAATFNQTVLQSGQGWAQPLLDNAALMEQVHAAAAAGETVAVPSRDLIGHVPMDMLKTLLPDMHVRPDGVTPRVAERDYEAATQEFNQRMDTALVNLENSSTADPIYADVESQLRNAGRGVTESAADATMVSERYTTRAARLSAELGYEIDPMTLYRADSLRVIGKNGAVSRNTGETINLNEDEAVTPSGMRIPVAYEVVEAADLMTSHDDDLNINPAFPKDLQPRDRTRAASADQIATIAGNIIPELLGRSTSVSEGAPIVGRDGVVESGNGRVMGLRRAYSENGQSQERYRQWLESQGYNTTGMQQPVLIRRRVVDAPLDERIGFTKESNQRNTLDLGASEQAFTDAGLLTDSVLDQWRGGSIESGKNIEFVRAFVANLSQSERGAVVDANGALSKRGIDRIRAAMVAKAYGDTHLVARAAESLDDNIKTISAVLTSLAPQWAKMRGKVERGEIAPDMDQTPALMKAVQMVARARDKGEKVADLANQLDLFDQGSQETMAFLKLLYGPDLKRAAGFDRLHDSLNSYIAEAEKNTAGQNMFGEKPLSAMDILMTTLRKDAAREGADKGMDLFNQSIDLSWLKDAGEKIRSVIAVARKDKTSKAKERLFTVPEWFSKIAHDRVGLDVSGYDVSVDAFAVRHTLNKHGDATAEEKRGNVAVTDEDIASFPVVVSDPDRIVMGVKNSRGQDQVFFIRTMEDGSTLVATEVRTGGRDVTLSSIRKYPERTDANTIVQATIHNVRNALSGIDPIVITKDEIVKSREGETYFQDNSYTATTIDIDGKTRPTTNANGQPLAQTEDGLRNFWRWFGNSKAVDDKGRPLVMYHGTGNLESMDSFDPSMTGRGKDQIGSGFYFTNSQDEASSYATVGENPHGKIGGYTSPGVVPVYVSINKPIVVHGANLDDSGVSITKKQAKSIIKRAKNIYDVDSSPLINWDDVSGGVTEKIITDVAENYAGENLIGLENDFFSDDATSFRIALHDVLGFNGALKKFPNGTKHFVAWFPEQIKSAVGNRGTFDPADPRILYQSNQEEGPFGPILRDFRGDAQGAIATLTEMKTGEAIGALNHPDIGDIDLVWGEEGTGQSDGYGLAKLVRWHPEVISDLQGILSSMQVTSRSKNRVNLESADHKAAIRLTWDGQSKNWLLTAFEKKEEGGGTTRTDTGTITGKDDTASLTTAHEEKGGDVPSMNTNTEAQTGDSPSAYPSDVIIQQRIDEFHQKSGSVRASVSFTESGIDVRLFKAANASSFLHESGHIFLKQLTDDVALIRSQPGYDPAKPGKLEQDLRTVLDWMGAKEADSITTEQHEMFARGFEQYLRDGKAPSPALRWSFHHFRQWLTRIYKRITDLKVDVSPEVKSVMDRLLAVDEAIAAQQEQNPPLLRTDDMTDAEWADYQDSVDRADMATTEEVTRWGLADHHILQSEGGFPLQTIKDAISNQVDAEMKTLPVWTAVSLIRGGDGKSGPLPMNRDEVRRIAGQTALMSLESKRNGNMLAAVGKDGIHPQDIADAAGYPTAEALLKDLAGLPSKADYRQQAVQAVLAERFGAFSEANLPQAVQAALLNQEQARKLDQEYRILSRKRSSADTAARQLARTTLEQQNPNQARDFNKHLRASLRARREADVAWGQGDRETAIKAKEREIMAHALARESRKIGQEMDKAQRYLHMLLTSKQTRLNIGNEAMAQVDALLMQADVPRPDKFTPLEATETLDAWQNRMADLGYDAVDSAPPKPWLQMTVGDVRDFVDTLKHIDHVGRTENKLLLEGEKESVAEAAAEMAKAVRTSKPGPLQRSGEMTPTDGDYVKDLAMSLDDMLLRPEKVIEYYDKGDVNGVFHRRLWRPLKEAQYAKDDRMKDILTQFKALQETRSEGNPKGIDKTRYHIGGKDMTHDNLIAIGLNLGNLDNMKKLLRGYQWNEAVLDEVKGKLTKADFDFIQGVLNLFEPLFSELSAVNAKVNGTGLPRVEPNPIVTPYGTYPGGYYPLVYDPRNAKVYGRNLKDDGKTDLANISGVVIAPRHSSRKTRVDNVNLPVLLDSSLAINALESSIHDITHTIPVINARKLFNNAELQAALVDNYGIHAVETWRGWLNAVSLDKTQDDPVRPFDRFLKGIRMRSTVVALGLRISTVVSQLGGIPQAMAYLGPESVIKGFSKVYLSRWSNIIAAWDQCNQLSGEFRHRNSTLDRDVRENTARSRGKNDPTSIVTKHAFAGIIAMEKMISLGVWHGAYDQHLEKHPTDFDGAIAYANGAITKTQGSGRAMDLAPLMRMNEWAKLFTMFYTPFSAAYGQTHHILRDLRYGNFKTKARAFQAFMLLNFSYILPDLLMGRFPGEDDDESFLWWAVKKSALGQLAVLPFARDAAQFFDTGFNGTSAPERLITTAGKAITAIPEAITNDDYDWLDASIDIADAATYIMPTPAGQLVSSLRAWKQQVDGKHDESVRGILFGNRR